MRVEQAVFGETLGGHALRAASDVTLIPSELAARLDLPDTAPPGVVWSPYVSGFALGDWYVLARTFADPAASRPGMVISHAVLAPLEEMVSWTDLRPLFALLIDSPKFPDALTAIDLTPSQVPQSATSDLLATAQALVARGKGPVVRVGLEECEQLIASLWANCWPAIRASFSFRLSFGPHDLVEVPEPTIVCSPPVLAARWIGHRVVGNDGFGAAPLAAAILNGSVEAAPILLYAQEIGAQLRRFSDLPLLERAFEASASAGSMFAQCLATIRLVERLSPDCSDGVTAKEALIEKFLLQLSKASVAEVLQLRNLTADGFASANRIWIALENWAAKQVFEPSDDAQMLAAINDALSISDALEPWRKAIIAGTCVASVAPKNAFPAAFWRWVAECGDVVLLLATHLPAKGVLEARLVDAAPIKMTEDAGALVMRIAKQKKWLALHGAAAGACLGARVAVDRQLSIDVAAEYLDGLRAALRSVPPKQLLEVAIDVEEPRLLQIAAERVADSPGLLRYVNVTDIRGQDLWLRALDINAATWDGPHAPKQAFFGILQGLMEGRAANHLLISVLSQTPLADLNGYQRVAEVWGVVQEPALGNLLRATSLGWFKRAADGGISTPDTRLQTFMLADAAFYRDLQELKPAMVCIQIMAALMQFSESRLVEWLNSWSWGRSPLSTSEAEALGYLILRRHWDSAANKLVKLMRSGRSDIQPALRICRELLGTIDRWRLKFSSRSVLDDWECLEAVAVDLYPGGPDYDGLWSRAGGRDADLMHSGSGRSRWHYTLDQIRKGKGLKATSLLNEMRRDYPSNELLQELMNEANF